METYLPLVGGLLLLVAGGELLVRGSVAVATQFGVSPLLIGLTLVGMGTSMPELVTSVQASLAGSPGIAVGNVVGSNIANILLVLGVSAMIRPIVVASNALWRDGAVVLAVAVLFGVVGAIGSLNRPVGALFLACFALYIFYAWRQERAAHVDHTSAFEKAEAYRKLHDGDLPAAGSPRQQTLLWAILTAVAGLAIVVAGGKFLVDGAVAIARSSGLPETVIGLTIVAVGTSMPEFVTSLVAALRGHSAVALGNILGSNIYNILGIGGATALIAPTIVPAEIVRFDALVMIAATAVLLVFGRSGWQVGRLEGVTLTFGYVVYLALLWPA